MPGNGHGNARELREFTDPEAAFAEITRIYEEGAAKIRAAFAEFAAGNRDMEPVEAFYPYMGIEIEHPKPVYDAKTSYGTLAFPGFYGTTLTRPDLFTGYLKKQIHLLTRSHGKPVKIGVSDKPIPLPFVIEEATSAITSDDVHDMKRIFTMPNLADIDDSIANGDYEPRDGEPFPMSLFSGPRVDLGCLRLSHYTATSPDHFQRFVLFTNYQRYVDEFIKYGKEQVADGDEYEAFVEPGDVVTPNPKLTDETASGTPLDHLPQMPAYHLKRSDRDGITLVNIGVGPSNAKTITDHIAVLRPHCWMMIGHCGGLRRTQSLGDYVLAHAYIREDSVLDDDLPVWVPVPPIAEVQVALQNAVADVTGLHGQDMKISMRTGTVATTDNRNWELRHDELSKRFSQSRAIAVDMESATIAANGFRFRVPYGTLLCVSDKPLHGELKLRGMANAFYRERISQHLDISIKAIEELRAQVDQLHSRKLRSFREPAFR